MGLQENSKVDVKEDQTTTSDGNKINPEKKNYFKTKIVLAIIVTSAIIIFGYLSYQHINTLEAQKKNQSNEKALAEVIYYDIPPIVVNLDTKSAESKFLKISISLVLKDNKSLEIVKELEPSIRDTYFVYLRQLRPSDVRGPIAIYRLREALLKRTSKTIYPGNIKDLLFREMLVQ